MDSSSGTHRSIDRTTPRVTNRAANNAAGSEAILCQHWAKGSEGTEELARYARNWRHRYGGTTFQTWPVVLSALAGLDRELPRLPDYVRHARTVADALAGLPGARVFPCPPHTHQFRMWLPYPAQALGAAVLALAEEERVWFAGGWMDTDVPGYAMTEVTVAGPALEWTAEDVTAVGAEFQKLLD